MSQFNIFWFTEEKKGPVEGCLTWDVFHHKVPWGVIILIGGGFAMAEASKKSGLSHWLGSQFGVIANLKKEVMLAIICSFTALLTEIMSNTAASSLLIPVLNDMVGIPFPLYIFWHLYSSSENILQHLTSERQLFSEKNYNQNDIK